MSRQQQQSMYRLVNNPGHSVWAYDYYLSIFEDGKKRITHSDVDGRPIMSLGPPPMGYQIALCIVLPLYSKWELYSNNGRLPRTHRIMIKVMELDQVSVPVWLRVDELETQKKACNALIKKRNLHHEMRMIWHVLDLQYFIDWWELYFRF